MVTCLSEIPHRETCYHFALIFAKLLTASRFSRTRGFRKTLPLSTIFALLHENRHFSPFGEKWRLRWNLKKSQFAKITNFSRNPALAVANSRFSWENHFWPPVARYQNHPATAAKKKSKNFYSGEFFSPKKFFDCRPVSIKKSTLDWAKATSKKGHFWSFFETKTSTKSQILARK